MNSRLKAPTVIEEPAVVVGAFQRATLTEKKEAPYPQSGTSLVSLNGGPRLCIWQKFYILNVLSSHYFWGVGVGWRNQT